MKIKDILKNYNIDKADFDSFLSRHSEIETIGFFDDAIADADVAHVVEQYKVEADAAMKEKTEQEKRNAEKEKRDLERRQAIPSVLVTSGFAFDGYSIKKYAGYVSGDNAIQINRSELFANAGQNLTDALALIRSQALYRLKGAAYDLGCNAVIGLDFDYVTFEPETANIGGGTLYQPYVVCVTANGNAVVIERD